jgi:hypothetical protein
MRTIEEISVQEDLLRGDLVWRFRRGASPRSVEDAIAGEFERAVGLLEARCEEAFKAETRRSRRHVASSTSLPVQYDIHPSGHW